MRLIDADALRDKLQNEIDKATPPYDDVIGSIRCGVRLARNIVEDEPTVDAVPISFMEEQKAWAEENGFDTLYANDLDFLVSAWAERKEE